MLRVIMIDYERLWSGLTGRDIVKISGIHYFKNGVYIAKSTLFTNWFLFPIKSYVDIEFDFYRCMKSLKMLIFWIYHSNLS